MKQFYLAGGMAGMDFKESNNWRVKLQSALLDIAKVINPNDFYSFEETLHDSEREVRNFDLNCVRHSDLIIVNFNQPNSIGTAQELAIANELRIPVVGLNEAHHDLHPWLVECVDKMFDNMNDLIAYVREYYY